MSPERNAPRPGTVLGMKPVRATAPALVTIPNVELLEVGEDWETSTGSFSWTRRDLESAIASQDDPGVRTPIVKLGHVDPRFDGQPSLGRIKNLRLTNNGQTLVGDLVGVPRWLGSVMASAYPKRSIEGGFDYTSRTGNTWSFVLTGVALLGDSYPAITTLDDIEALWGEELPVMVPAEDVAATDGVFRAVRAHGDHDQSSHGNRGGSSGGGGGGSSSSSSGGMDDPKVKKSVSSAKSAMEDSGLSVRRKTRTEKGVDYDNGGVEFEDKYVELSGTREGKEVLKVDVGPLDTQVWRPDLGSTDVTEKNGLKIISGVDSPREWVPTGDTEALDRAIRGLLEAKASRAVRAHGDHDQSSHNPHKGVKSLPKKGDSTDMGRKTPAEEVSSWADENLKAYVDNITSYIIDGNQLAPNDIDFLEDAMEELKRRAKNKTKASAPDPRSVKAKRMKVSASVTVDDIRKQFYASMGGDKSRQFWWVREVRLDPLELIVDDDEGGLFRVPVSMDGDTPSFGQVQPVRMEYVAATSKMVAASWRGPSQAGRPRQTKRPGANPTHVEGSSMQLSDAALRKLGLDPESATEDDIEAAVLALETGESVDSGESADGNEDEKSTGSTDDGAEETASADQGEPVAANIPEGFVLMDEATLADLQSGVAAARRIEQEQQETEQRQFLEAAVRAGKFPRARLEHYKQAWAADPQGTRELITKLSPGIVPISEQGSVAATLGGDSTEEQNGYPAGWRNRVEATRRGATGRIKVVSD